MFLVEFRIRHSLSELAARWVANVKSTPLGEGLLHRATALLESLPKTKFLVGPLKAGKRHFDEGRYAASRRHAVASKPTGRIERPQRSEAGAGCGGLCRSGLGDQ